MRRIKPFVDGFSLALWGSSWKQPRRFDDNSEGEPLLAAVGGHEIAEAAQGGWAPFAAVFYPMHGHADDRTAKYRQIDCGGAVADRAAVFPGDDAQGVGAALMAKAGVDLTLSLGGRKASGV